MLQLLFEFSFRFLLTRYIRSYENDFDTMKQASPGSKKIVGVFYKANEYAELNPNFLGCEERALGIRDWLESQGHKYIVTDDKEGPNCG